MLNTLSTRACAHAMKRTRMRSRMRTGGWRRREGLGTRGAGFFYVNRKFVKLLQRKKGILGQFQVSGGCPETRHFDTKHLS